MVVMAEHPPFYLRRYVWPSPFTLEMQSCGRPGSYWDDEARKVTLCYELAFDFAELYRAGSNLFPDATRFSKVGTDMQGPTARLAKEKTPSLVTLSTAQP
jgi:hypothetical protein